MISVLVVDDHALVRSGVVALLKNQPDIKVCGEVGTVDEALAVLARTAPDVALVDITLGPDDGIAFAEVMRRRWPSVKLVAVTMHDDAATVRQMLRAGAVGYVVKGARSHELMDAIRAAHRSEAYIHPSVAQFVIADAVRAREEVAVLSPREREVARLLGTGRTSRECAEVLGLSEHTVNRHVSNAMRKLGLHDRTRIVEALARDPSMSS